MAEIENSKDLISVLWSGADILRSKMDANEYKDYILGFIFYKYLSDKEEQWLNQMAQSGWLLDKVGLCIYRFVRCEPVAYSVRLEMHPCDKDYLSFMEDAGAEYVGRMLQWVYFRKKLTDGPFDLFSDIDSRIRHLERVGNPLLVLGLANLAIGITNSIQANAEYAWINLLCATLLMYGLGRNHGKNEALEKERLLRE